MVCMLEIIIIEHVVVCNDIILKINIDFEHNVYRIQLVMIYTAFDLRIIIIEHVVVEIDMFGE